MGNKRRYTRYVVEGIEGNMLFATEVNILNISLGGAAIEADKRLNMGSEYTLKLRDNKKAIALKGIVVWSLISKTKPNKDGDIVPMYQAGLRFTNVLSDRSTELLEFMEDHKTEDDQRLSGLRFVIDASHEAYVHYPFNYRVKKISAGGMLVECDQELQLEDNFPMEIFLEKGVPITFHGRIASCIPLQKEDSVLFDVGIEFIEMTEDHRKSLKDFLADL